MSQFDARSTSHIAAWTATEDSDYDDAGESWFPDYIDIDEDELIHHVDRYGPSLVEQSRREVLGVSLCTYCAVFFEYWEQALACFDELKLDCLYTTYYCTFSEVG